MSTVILLRQPCLHRKNYRCAACRIAAVNAHHTADMLAAYDAEIANRDAHKNAAAAQGRELRELIEKAERASDQTSGERTIMTQDESCDACGVRAESRTCADCGATAMVIDCGHHAQPAEIAASARDGRPVCADCEAAS